MQSGSGALSVVQQPHAETVESVAGKPRETAREASRQRARRAGRIPVGAVARAELQRSTEFLASGFQHRSARRREHVWALLCSSALRFTH